MDSKEALLACKAARFKVYLSLRVKQSRIKKESTIFTYWKNLSMLYARTAARHMDESVLFDIGNVMIPCSSIPLDINSYTVASYFYNSRIRLGYFRKGKGGSFRRGPLRPPERPLGTRHRGLYSRAIAGTDVSSYDYCWVYSYQAKCTCWREGASIQRY